MIHFKGTFNEIEGNTQSGSTNRNYTNRNYIHRDSHEWIYFDSNKHRPTNQEAEADQQSLSTLRSPRDQNPNSTQNPRSQSRSKGPQNKSQKSKSNIPEKFVEKSQKINLYRNCDARGQDLDGLENFPKITEKNFSSMHFGMPPAGGGYHETKVGKTTDGKFASIDTIDFEISDGVSGPREGYENYQFLTPDPENCHGQSYLKKSETVSVNSYIKQAKLTESDKNSNT
jgi:hypothetical protein